MAPAAAGLLHPARYASGVLTGLARLPALHLPFDYVSPGELALGGRLRRRGRRARLGVPEGA